MKIKSFVILSALLFFSTIRSTAQDLTRNKETVRQLFEDVLGKEEKLSQFLDLHTKDFMGHGLKIDYNLDKDFQSAKSLVQMYEGSTGGIKITHLVAEGQLVCARWIAKGTLKSGQNFEFDGNTIFRLSDYKIAEEWSLVNQPAMMGQ